MPMHATTVRFSDDLWEILEEEARRQGASAAQLVRDATLLRLSTLVEARGAGADDPTLAALATARARGDRGHAPPPGVTDGRRLAAVRATGLLDANESPAVAAIGQLAARVLGAPVALVSLVEADRQFFASCVGLPEPWRSSRETPLSHSFCQYAVSAREPLVVWDAREHPLLRDNLAIRDLGVVAYLGVPLIASDGAALGTLCVIDHEPRVWTADQVDLVSRLAAMAVREIERR